jgi:hypothetical protein
LTKHDDACALVGLLEKWDGTANGRRAVDVVRELLDCPRLPPDLAPTIDALSALRAAQHAEEEAISARREAEVALAEVVGVQRCDKDTGFEAEHDAVTEIIDALLTERAAEKRGKS